MNAGPSFRELIPTHASSLLAAACLLAALVVTATDPDPLEATVVEQAPPMFNVGELGMEATNDVASFSLSDTSGCIVNESTTELVCSDAQNPEASATDLETTTNPDAT